MCVWVPASFAQIAPRFAPRSNWRVPARTIAQTAIVVPAEPRSARSPTGSPLPQRDAGPPLFLCLDEVANIAPIHNLPALVSGAGGQRLHLMACLQDLSHAPNRWGEAAAGGFLSLFQTKLILTGIADSRSSRRSHGRSAKTPASSCPTARASPTTHPVPPNAATRGNRAAAH